MSLSDVIFGVPGTSVNAILDIVQDVISSNFNVVSTPTETDAAHIGSAFSGGYDGEHMTLVVRETGAGGLAKKVIGQNIPITLGGLALQNDIIFVTDKLIVESASEDRSCRLAPLFSFGQPLVYSSGDNPYVFRYSGKLLVNKLDGDSKNQFYSMYKKYLRASSNLAGKNRTVVPWVVELNYRDMYRKGYVVDCNISVNSMQPVMAELTFSLFVIEDRFNQ